MAKLSGQSGPTLTTIADPRTRAMYGRYAEGDSLQDVGAEFGLSRERVRQIFTASGLRTRSPGATAKLRRARIKSDAAAGICAAFLRSSGPSRIAASLGVSETLVKEVLRERLPVVYRGRGRNRPRRYEDGELLAILRVAAEHWAGPGPLSTNAYRAIAVGRRTADGRPWPAPQTIAARFGRWRSALIEAGLPSGRTSSRGRKRRFDSESCKRALREAAAQLGAAPSAPEYGVLARASGGRLPSYKTVRRHFDSWAEALWDAGLLDEHVAILPQGAVAGGRWLEELASAA